LVEVGLNHEPADMSGNVMLTDKPASLSRKTRFCRLTIGLEFDSSTRTDEWVTLMRVSPT